MSDLEVHRPRLPRYPVTPRLTGAVVVGCLMFGCLLYCGFAVAAEPDGVARSGQGRELSRERVREGFTDKPRWEFGVGGGYLQGFDYPGSSDPNRGGIALPFVVYRSPVVRVGGNGFRAVAIEQAGFRVDVSFGGGIASSSESDGVRAGMADLDFLFQIGPRAQFIVANRATEDGGRFQFSVTAAVRGVVSTDFGSVDGQGLLAELALSVTRRRVFGSRFDTLARVSSTWAEDRLHEYFYEVEPRFATADRPAFDASGGYLGTNVFIGTAFKPVPNLNVFAGIQQGLYGGAANEDSPLFETRRATGFALGFTWTIKKSAELVSIVDVDA